MMDHCPGQDTRYWTPEDVFDVPCPVCDTVVEFFKTDRRRTCTNCGYRFNNPHLEAGCAQWCAYAEECLGYKPEEQPQDIVKGPMVEELTEAMKDEFGDDYGRIAHTLRVLREAQGLLADEDGDARVVTAAALLHDIGAERPQAQQDASAPQEQETGGPAVVREILQRTGLDERSMQQVCDILRGLQSDGDIDLPEFRIVWDARRLATLSESPDVSSAASPETLANTFRTSTGAEKAREVIAGE